MSYEATQGFADDDRPEDGDGENLLVNPEFLARTNRKSFIKREKERKANALKRARESRGTEALVEMWFRGQYEVDDNDSVETTHLFERQYRCQIRQAKTHNILKSVFITYFNRKNVTLGYAPPIPQTQEIAHVG